MEPLACEQRKIVLTRGWDSNLRFCIYYKESLNILATHISQLAALYRPKFYM